MTMDREEQELLEALQDLQRDDEISAPPFDAVLTRRRAVAVMSWKPIVLASAVAAAAVVLTVIGVQQRAGGSRITVPAEVLALSSWRPMTDVLLETPNRQLLTDTPDLYDTMLPVPRTSALEAIETDTRLRW